MADFPIVVVASGLSRLRDRWGAALRERTVVYEAVENATLQETVAEHRPGVLVLDIALPGLGRVEGLQRLRQLSPATKIIVLSDSETEGEGVGALMAGAKGYYSRAIEPPALAKAVVSVEAGELWVKRTLVQAVVTALVARAEVGKKEHNRRPDRRRLECLTQRQREVAEAIACGASNKEIANRLNVTERTVKAHLTEMFRNVGVFDRLHLALLLNDVPGSGFELHATLPGRAARRRAQRPSQQSGGGELVDTASSE